MGQGQDQDQGQGQDQGQVEDQGDDEDLDKIPDLVDAEDQAQGDEDSDFDPDPDLDFDSDFDEGGRGEDESKDSPPPWSKLWVSRRGSQRLVTGHAQTSGFAGQASTDPDSLGEGGPRDHSPAPGLLRLDDSGDSSDEEQEESIRPPSAVRSPQSEVQTLSSSNHQLPLSSSSTPSTLHHQLPQISSPSATVRDDGAPGCPGQPPSGMLGNPVCVHAPAGHTSSVCVHAPAGHTSTIPFNHQCPLPTSSTSPRDHHQPLPNSPSSSAKAKPRLEEFSAAISDDGTPEAQPLVADYPDSPDNPVLIRSKDQNSAYSADCSDNPVLIRSKGQNGAYPATDSSASGYPGQPSSGTLGNPRNK